MNITRCVALGAAALLLCGGSAFAQQVGTYSGTSADGQALSFTVGTDDSGNMIINSVSAGVTTTMCSKSSVTPFGFGTGYNPNAAIDASGKTSYVEEYSYTYQMVKGTFSGNKFSGTIYSSSPTLILPPNNAKPTASTVCVSPSQKFSATLNTAAIAAASRQLAKVPVYTIKK